MTASWQAAYQSVRDRAQADRAMPALVRVMASYPRGNTRRAIALSEAICTRLGLDAAAWRGTVYGAALDLIGRRARV